MMVILSARIKCRVAHVAAPVLLGLLSLVVTAPAPAAMLLYEDFNYTPGANLSNQTNVASGNQWLRPSAPAGASQVIAAGDVAYPGLGSTTSNSVSIPRPATGGTAENRIDVPGRPYTRASGATLYFSFTMRMTDWTFFAANGADTKNDGAAKNATHRKGGFVGGFHGGAASTTTAMSATNGFAAPIMVRREIDYSQTGTDGTPGTQTGRYELGILKRADAPALPADLETAFDLVNSFAVGDTVFVVGQYDFVDTTSNTFGDIAKLWVNPMPGNSAAEASPSAVAPATAPNLAGTLSLESFHVRADTNTPGNVLIDNIRVGTTFADVMPVPEPCSVAFIVAAMFCSACTRTRKRCSKR